MVVCLVIVEMVRPPRKATVTPDDMRRKIKRWRLQREHDDSLSPAPEEGEIRLWRGQQDERDWDRLVAFQERNGWYLLSHRREFVTDNAGGERQDKVEFAVV